MYSNYRLKMHACGYDYSFTLIPSTNQANVDSRFFSSFFCFTAPFFCSAYFCFFLSCRHKNLLPYSSSQPLPLILLLLRFLFSSIILLSLFLQQPTPAKVIARSLIIALTVLFIFHFVLFVLSCQKAA